MLGFDTETTGIDTETARVVTAACVSIDGPTTPIVFGWMIAVDVEIPAGATKVHGITTEQARREGVPAPEALDGMAEQLAIHLDAGIPVVGMNCCFDLTLLDRELRRNGLATLEERLNGPVLSPVVDVMVIDRKFSRRPGKRTLTDLCQFYDVRLDGAHGAAADALAACRVAWRMARLYPQLGQMDLHDLHQAQAGWRASQMNNLRAYFDSQRKKHDGCDPAWPVRPYKEETR